LTTFARLTEDIRACRACEAHLPLGPRPVIQAHPTAQVLIVGQAPGTAVHKSGKPFDDPSGERLRRWLGVDEATFYDAKQVALVPMGFCYPGRGKGGDLPPRPECAATWRKPLLAHLTEIRTTVLVGRYAIDWHLRPARRKTLATLVRESRAAWPQTFALPHPSPRNSLWLRRNPWLEDEVVPALQQRIAAVL
jgi:uracil-DNA glycosylase